MHLRTMLAPFTALCFVFVLGTGCGDDDGDDGGGGGNDACARYCAKIAAVGCSEDDDEASCVSSCQTLRSASCATELDASNNCEADQPTADFECDEDDEAMLTTDACNAEALAFFTCFIGG